MIKLSTLVEGVVKAGFDGSADRCSRRWRINRSASRCDNEAQISRSAHLRMLSEDGRLLTFARLPLPTIRENRP